MDNIQTEADALKVSRRNRIRRIGVLIFSLGIISGFIYYLFVNSEKYLNLLRLSPLYIALLFLLACTSPFLNGAINTLMFRGLGANLSHREGILLAAVSTLANQLPVSGGVITKGFYLKRKYDISYAKFLSAMLALFFCTVAVYGLLGLIILLQWTFLKQIRVPPPLWIGFGGMLSVLLVFGLPVQQVGFPQFMRKWLTQALTGWSIISRNLPLILKLLGIQTTMMILLAVRYWLAFHMLAQDVTIGQVLLFSCATILTNLVSFVPGGLGVREAIVGGIAFSLGFDSGTSVVAIGLDRLVATIVILIAGWIGSLMLGREISKIPAETDEQNS